MFANRNEPCYGQTPSRDALLTAGTFAVLVWWLALGKVTLAKVWAAPKSDIFIVMGLAGFIALLWAIRALQLLWKVCDELRNWRFGLRGEQAVAEKLMDRELAAAGYVVFHDLPAEKWGKKWNVDHVVVGPGGVFVLETKAKSRRKANRDQEEHKVIFNGQVLQFPWCYDDEAVEQVDANADWIREYLGVYAPKDILIQPVIVVPGWYVESKGNYPVKAMNAEYLVRNYLTKLKPVYSREQLATVIQRLDDGCRGLEF